MKVFVTKFPIAIVACFLFIVYSSASAEDSPAKGVVIFKNGQYDKDETARALEYSEIRPANIVVNGTAVDGTPFTILKNRFVSWIEYPNLRSGTFRYSAEIESFKETGRKLVEATQRHPLSKPLLQPKIDELKSIAEKLNDGQIFVRGKWTKENESAMAESIPSKNLGKEGKQNGETLVFEGKEITGRVKEVYPHAVIVETASGVFNVPLAHQSQKIREKFNFDERAARQYLEERNKAAQSRKMAEQAMRAERKHRESSSQEKFRVIQVLDDGFLVDRLFDPRDLVYLLRFAPDLVIHEDAPFDSLSEISDGTVIRCRGYFTENFQYEALSGARKTVKTFLAYRVLED